MRCENQPRRSSDAALVAERTYEVATRRRIPDGLVAATALDRSRLHVVLCRSTERGALAGEQEEGREQRRKPR
jgi:hypothetical protein